MQPHLCIERTPHVVKGWFTAEWWVKYSEALAQALEKIANGECQTIVLAPDGVCIVKAPESGTLQSCGPTGSKQGAM
jgi:hypothetical protein